MAYIKQDDLLKRIFSNAVKDRTAFIDAVGGDADLAEETRMEIARIEALAGKTVKEAFGIDREAVRLACLFAEVWFVGLADAQIGREKIAAQAMYAAVHKFRMKHFGRNTLEAQMANAKLIPIKDIMAHLGQP